MMTKIECVCCDTELTGKLDTYGDVGEEMCKECYFTMFDDWKAWKFGQGVPHDQMVMELDND